MTRITNLPMRSRLIALTGTGTNLNFTFEGEGQVHVVLNGDPSNFNVIGADSVSNLGPSEIGLNFTGFGIHVVSVELSQ